MSDRWWETYEWVRFSSGRRSHAVLSDADNWTACGIGRHGRIWRRGALVPRCRSCERSIAATVKRCAGKEAQ